MATARRSAAAEEGVIDGHRKQRAEESKGGEAEADQRGPAPQSRKNATPAPTYPTADASLVFSIATLLYLNTLANDLAFDDHRAIERKTFFRAHRTPHRRRSRPPSSLRSATTMISCLPSSDDVVLLTGASATNAVTQGLLLASSAAASSFSSSVPTAAKYFLAGGICAAVSHTGSVPIDVVKTRIQLDANEGRFAGKSLVAVSTQLIAEDGPWSLWAGAVSDSCRWSKEDQCQA